MEASGRTAAGRPRLDERPDVLDRPERAGQVAIDAGRRPGTAIAAGSSISDRTRLNGGVCIAAATTRPSRETVARYGAPVNSSGDSRRFERDAEDQVVLGLARDEERPGRVEEVADLGESTRSIRGA